MQKNSMITCDILGVRVAVTDMKQVVEYTCSNIEHLRGGYYCVSNVHTLVMAADVEKYRKVQNCANLVLPDGAPLSMVSKARGYHQAKRVTGPDFMEQMFNISNQQGSLKHFFYGSTQETLDALKEQLEKKYPQMQIVGMISPPFRSLTKEEEDDIFRQMKEASPDIIWIGLGAPKQEMWMYRHRRQFSGLMVGVGAGFNYHAGLLERAPMWMQKTSLEWLYRLLQEPKRLWKRYLQTNVRFALYLVKEKFT